MKKMYEEPRLDMERFVFEDMLANMLSMPNDGDIDPFNEEAQENPGSS